MIERPEKNLLTDTLAEASPPDFRAALLDETLRHARRRRHWRHARQAGGLVVLAILAAVLNLQREPETVQVKRPTAKISAPKTFQSIETQPLAESAIVETTSFPVVKIISGQPAIVEIVTSQGNFKYIGDNELLALVGNYPVALVRTGPNSEELVFANPDDQKKFFGN